MCSKGERAYVWHALRDREPPRLGWRRWSGEKGHERRAAGPGSASAHRLAHQAHASELVEAAGAVVGLRGTGPGVDDAGARARMGTRRRSRRSSGKRQAQKQGFRFEARLAPPRLLLLDVVARVAVELVVARTASQALVTRAAA